MHLLSAEERGRPAGRVRARAAGRGPAAPAGVRRADRRARGRGRVAARRARRAARAGGRAAHRARRLTVFARTARVDSRRARPSVRGCSKVFEAVREAGVKRFGVGLAVLMAIGLAVAVPAQATYKAPQAVKINVMGEWAHPDDDTSIIGPCGVWHQRYGVRCGIIMVTRGEGGGNAVGTEIGPALGLRRENEDRVAHYRSGTVDIFNLDRVDFFYNQSAPLTQYFWGEDETLRRVTRIIRMTQPEVYIGFTPTLERRPRQPPAGGPLHLGGRPGRGRPEHVPRAARAGRTRSSTWQVKKVFSGGSTAGTGGTTHRRRLHHRLRPAPARTSTPSPASGPATTRRTVAGGQRPGQAGGHAEDLGAGRGRGRARLPDAEPHDVQGHAAAGLLALRHDRLVRAVPAEHDADGTREPAGRQGRRDPLRRDQAGPGRAPARARWSTSTFSRFFNVAGRAVRGDRARPLRPGTLAGRHGRADGAGRLDGRRGQADRRRSRRGRESTVDLHGHAGAPTRPSTRTTSSRRCSHRRGDRLHRQRRARRLAGRGPLPALGQLGGVRQLAHEHGARGAAVSAARPASSRSASARRRRSRSTSTTGPTRPQSGTVTLGAAGELHRRRAVASRTGRSRPARTRRSSSRSTNTDTMRCPARRQRRARSRSRRRYSRPARGGETLTVVGRPDHEDPAGRRRAGGRRHRRAPASTPARRSTSAAAGRAPSASRSASTAARPARPATRDQHVRARSRWHGDDLYFFVHVRDDFQSYAVTPAECVAHWLADSVEILIDPRGNASETNMDTATTFKLGVFPFTNDPTGSNGNGPNGPCWERDADNHQGYSTGPLADTVSDAPNAPGVEVASSATWVGTNETTVDHAYAGGGYDLEVKIPMADLPAAVDPAHIGLNITPVRQRQQRGAGHDDAAPHRPGHPARVVGVRQRPVRPVALGPRHGRRLHAAGRPADDAGAAERVEPEPRRGRLAADDRPVGARRRADQRPRPAPQQRPDRDVDVDLARERGDAARSAPTARARARVPVVGRQGLHPGVDDELRARRPTRRRTTG